MGKFPLACSCPFDGCQLVVASRLLLGVREGSAVLCVFVLANFACFFCLAAMAEGEPAQQGRWAGVIFRAFSLSNNWSEQGGGATA